MNITKNIWIILAGLGLLIAILPGIGEYSFKQEPSKLLEEVMTDDVFLSVDQVATMLNNEEETLQLIDLRREEEFKLFNIPGAINVPFHLFFESRPETWLYNKETQYVFYSNDDVNAAYALTLAKGLGYENCQLMKGGLNLWFEVVMKSEFAGQRITPRENALFENRMKAREFFTEINSLPDSLKQKYAESKRQAERNLDGGCN